ncbi:hypothetical protein BJ322DRAFT_1218964 [Thelephora terrestris]|uniref:Uncharacterized protein n=1 Tax=Thelephora terrestris TaxID=56493 RepID=A0A9P6L706_9AGAM|nr:hypothetical protein BJ322DRAFT_1218964 [Thelephora terrestris]
MARILVVLSTAVATSRKPKTKQEIRRFVTLLVGENTIVIGESPPSGTFWYPEQSAHIPYYIDLSDHTVIRIRTPIIWRLPGTATRSSLAQKKPRSSLGVSNRLVTSTQHVRWEKLGTVRSSQQGQDYAGDTTAPRQSQSTFVTNEDLGQILCRVITTIFSDMQFPVPQQHTHLFLVTDLRTARLRLPRRDPLNAHDQTTGRALLESWHSIIASPIPSAEGLTQRHRSLH